MNVTRTRWRPWLVPALFVLFLAGGLAGTWLAPYDPTDVDLTARYQPPLTSLAHILGTDHLGRDMLSRVLVGANISIGLALIVIVFSCLSGTLVGMVAGFAGGRMDGFLMRIVDAMLALPPIMLALFIVAVIGPGFWSVTASLILVSWARYARFVRGEVLSLRARDYIDAAIVCGTHPLKILGRHFLPYLVNSIVVLLTLDVGRVILLESSLAFLGLGLPAERAAWGSTIAEGKAYLQTAPWVPLLPALAMMITIMLANGFGNWLSDQLDPRLRSSQS